MSKPGKHSNAILPDCSIQPAHIFSGLAFALLLHLMFFFLFKTVPHDESTVTSRQLEPKLSILKYGEQASAQEKHLIEELRYNDPTLLTLPNEINGFSYLLSDRKKRIYTPAQPYRFQVPEENESSLHTQPLTIRSVSMAEALSSDWPRTFIAEKQSYIPKSLPNQVIWHLSNGEVLDNMPLPEQERIAQAAATLTGPTVVRMIRNASFTRISLEKSCGESDLDQHVVSTLYSLTRRMPGNSVASAPDSAIKPRLPYEGQSLVVEVEWRLAASRKEGDS